MVASDRRELSYQTFDNVANSHTRGDTMRIYQHIWYHSFNSKRHVLLSVCHSTCTFLAVSTSEFISYLRYPDTSDSHFSKFIVILVVRHKHHIDITPLSSPRL